MEWIVGIVVALVVVALMLTSLLRSKVSEEPGYRLRDNLVSPAERSLFGVLEQAIGTKRKIFAKVRVADVLTPQKGLDRSKWQSAFNKISGKHFDYVLCDPETLEVREVVELNDKSHKKRSRAERDEFLEKACDSAGLKLIVIQASRSYVIDDIRQQVEGGV